ncbi:MAG: dephospho-CoA kinase [Erysipelothrix sp.]|jgi:dephospho-CoA kinase|nr:dephospho-CoA kinase [Erysipelothrix sp.]
MYVIAITGSMGSGKSSALRFFRSLGYPAVSADEIVHTLYRDDKPLQLQIEALAGQPLITQEGIDRSKLAPLFFGNLELKTKIESIVHARVFEEVSKWRKLHQNHLLGFVEVPLLFESESQVHYDETLMIAVDDNIQKKRLLKFRKMLPEEMEKRLACQMPQARKIELADTVIYNNSSKNQLKQALNNYLQEVKRGLRENETLHRTK